MKLTCVVDNSVRTASSLWGEHGLAFIIETGDGKILFDTGQSGTVLLHNLRKLKEEPKDISAIVLSHGHYDHTGGLISVLESTCGLPVIAHSSVLEERFAMRRKKAPRSIGIQFGAKKLSKWADLRLGKKAVEVLPGLWTTGTIYNRQFPEGRSPKHVVPRTGQYVPDPYLDDLSLVWKSEDGLVIVLGCAHAGLLNILSQVRDKFAEPIRAVIGGMHLHGADDAGLSEVGGVLSADYAGLRLYPNHCTGMRGFLALEKALGDMVEPCPAGTILEL
jgi:7,8-dihydropterin-6-yl-methyl-4-(beta-D-ribofuranosyl)aminobenzene 5'-phosphate synthase